MKSLEEVITWLKQPDHITAILVVIQNVPDASVTYLSNKPFVTSSSDTPANQKFIPCIVGGISFNESLSLNNTVNISYGDIEIDNTDGAKDAWLQYVWTNKTVTIYIGDVGWNYSDFRPIFSGLIADISSRSASSLNLIIVDKLQKLNNPISDALLPTINTTNDVLIPLTFGEVFNVTPIVTDNVINTLEYQVHNGPIEDIIEVRDNGVPVSFTKNLTQGKFTLSQSPYGQVTCSVQGYHDVQNSLKYSEEFNNAIWTKTGVTVVTNSIASPDTTTTAEKLTGTLADSFIAQTFSVNRNTTYTFTVWIKTDSTVGLRVYLGNNNGTAGSSFTVVNANTTWKQFSVTHTTSSTTTEAFVQIGGGSTFIAAEVAYVWGAQVTVGSIPGDYVLTTANPATVYYNDIANIIQRIVTKFGSDETRLTLSDIDLSNFGTFSAANTQAVGVYVKAGENILTVCNQLASSIGAQLTVSSTGLLRLVKMVIPGSGLDYSITPNDIEENSLTISDKPEVRAATKLGYCKNWTLQEGSIAAGIPSQNINLFETEWLYSTVVDDTVKVNYKLTAEPTEESTLLIKKTEADTEAARRNDLWSEPRFIYTVRAYAHMLPIELGDSVTLTDERFGLAAGKEGTVVNISRSWLSGRITLGVLI